MPLTEAGLKPKTKESARLAPAAECAASLAKCFGFRKAGSGMPASRNGILPSGTALIAKRRPRAIPFGSPGMPCRGYAELVLSG
ncbi:hypothetical protein HKB47_07950 [Mesorhizobium japonicum]|uniref:Uncharacterized protein n=2 Tax=Mesorhizobium japonicum TaxID=2066070 RepID=A0ABX6MNF5_9HYPH|nr:MULTISPECIES: hypothetical protein [Mesorhizobium]MBE1706955.1 hypothetical protein [Mesorhizobium japonicum]MBE1716146.1 hypothetical protein [Mesorhizobium japonicum]MUT20824.1 hypothetical protein [Mesorhizobium japonicum]MUT28280.1 hypothetical protein [Mesorhizobium japonicum]QJF00873.1 hypothetical protein R7A2020_07950 [Mesorhizobium japonicum R7A]